MSILVPSTIPVVEDKSLKTPYQVIEVDPAADKGNPRALPTTSPAPARSCPRSRRSVSLPGSEAGSPPGVISCPLLCLSLPARWSSHLAALMLAEPVSQQSVAGAARYPMRQAGAGAATVLSAVCHHDPDRLHPGHIPASQSALYPLLTDNMFLLDLLLCCRGWSHCSPQTW